MFTKARGVVEIGAGHVACARFEGVARGRLRMLECSVERVDASAIFEPVWRESVAGALQALRERHGAVGEVTVVLPPHLTLTKFVRVPRVNAAKRERIVQFEAQQALPLALDDLAWDSAVAGETDHETELLLSAVKRENLDALQAALEGAGFVSHRMVPAFAAMLAGYRQVQEPDAVPTMLFDVGARSVMLALIEPERFCGRSFALGGPAAVDHLTTDILALRLKQEATRTLMHFGRQTARAKPQRIMLTGGGAQVVGLMKSLAEKFGLPVVPVELTGAVDGPANAGICVSLMGAAAIELQAEPSAMDLRPAQQKRDETKRRRQPWLAAASAMVALVMLPPLVHYRALATAAARKTAAIERELAPLRVRDTLSRANLQKLEAARREEAELRKIVVERSAWVEFLADLQTRLVATEDVWLEQMKVLPAPTTVSNSGAGTPAPMRLALSGRMLDRVDPRSKTSDETYRRVRWLLDDLKKSTFVAGIEAERFDQAQPGLLRFDFVVVAKASAGL